MTLTPDIMTPDQRRVAEATLDQQSARRRHIVVALSGAHAYGFPSPDSDLDLKAIHIAPTRDWLGLEPPQQAADFLEVIDGVEIDYTSNEIGGVLRGILAGNGNYIERVLGPILLRRSDEHASLREICQGALSRHVQRHYRGFALNQYKAVESSDTPPAKRILYVLRTALTGTHLLRTGQLITDVGELLDDYGYGAARALIEAKKAGEMTLLDSGEKARWMRSLDRALDELEAAVDTSCLPAEPPNRAEANQWLVDTRLSLLSSLS